MRMRGRVLNVYLCNACEWHVCADVGGVPDVRGDLEAGGGGGHVPVPGGARSAAGPAPQLRGRAALRARHLEVRTPARLLQGPHAVPPPCNAQHLPRHAHLGEVHQ
jgi:hypothetical protein